MKIKGVSLGLVSALCMSICQVSIRKLLLFKIHFSIKINKFEKYPISKKLKNDIKTEM